jgi:hypothetical protein
MYRINWSNVKSFHAFRRDRMVDWTRVCDAAENTGENHELTNVGRLRLVARNKFVLPGGYKLSLLLADGDALCADCVRVVYPELYREGGGVGVIVGCEVDQGEVFCDGCGIDLSDYDDE